MIFLKETHSKKQSEVQIIYGKMYDKPAEYHFLLKGMP